MENALAIHTTSDLEAKELRRFAWRLPRIATIPNGIDEIANYDESKVSADIKELTAEQPFTLYFGRISWKKGLDRLLDAFALRGLGRLLIVGVDDENLATRLSQRARDLDIADRVRFLPRTVMGTDKEHLYASARVFVLPSYSENFGNTVLEAMRWGVPVVVTPEVGASEIVRECGGGIVAQGDPEPFGAAIGRLIEDEGLARSMGEAGRSHVMERYTWSRVAARMEDLYASLRVLH